MMNKRTLSDIFFASIGLAVLALALEYWPVVLGGTLLYLGYRGYARWMGSEVMQARSQRRRAQSTYETMLARYANDQSEDAHETAMVDWGCAIYHALPRSQETIDEAISLVLTDLFTSEGFNPVIPQPPIVGNSMVYARYHDTLSRIATHGYDADKHAVAQGIVLEALSAFVAQVPQTHGDVIWGQTEVRHLMNTPDAIEAILLPFYSREAHAHLLFTTLREQCDRNLCDIVGLPYSTDNATSDKVRLPTDHPNLDDPVSAYLKDTPLLPLFRTPVPVAIQTHDRWEHHWIIAATGHGKTQTLAALILDDLARVAAGECAVIVMDSNAQLIDQLAHLAVFAPGGALADRLILIDPQDDWPLALNLFDLGLDSFAALSKAEQDRCYNTTIEIYEYLLSALLGAEMTQKQGTLFRYVIRLLLTIPKATIHTLLDLMSPTGAEAYRPYMTALEGTARTFFETHFFEGEFKRSRPEIHRRLLGLLANTAFDAMFSAQHNALHLHAALASGSVILISTAKTHLGDEASRIFGRFFIGLIWQATKQRFEEDHPLPAYVYIDEAVEYFDDHIGTLLRQARKSRIGLIMAHQDIDGIPESTLAALRTNAAIRMAGGIASPQDRRRIASIMGVNADLIAAQPKAAFVTSVRGGLTNASIQFPIGALSNEPAMSDAHFSALKARQRQHYYYDPSARPASKVSQNRVTPSTSVMGEAPDAMAEIDDFLDAQH